MGNYEFLRIGTVDVPNEKVYFTSGLVNGYGESGNNNIGTGSGQQRVVLVRVPNYQNVTLNGTLSADGWDGSNKGGVVAMARQAPIWVGRVVRSMEALR